MRLEVVHPDRRPLVEGRLTVNRRRIIIGALLLALVAAGVLGVVLGGGDDGAPEGEITDRKARETQLGITRADLETDIGDPVEVTTRDVGRRKSDKKTLKKSGFSEADLRDAGYDSRTQTFPPATYTCLVYRARREAKVDPHRWQFCFDETSSLAYIASIPVPKGED